MVGGIDNEGKSMPKPRKNHPPSFKAKVAVEAIKAHKTIAQIAQMAQTCSRFSAPRTSAVNSSNGANPGGKEYSEHLGIQISQMQPPRNINLRLGKTLARGDFSLRVTWT